MRAGPTARSANLDLASTIPELDLYDRHWPIWTNQEQLPPGKFVRDLNGQQGAITNLLVCGGCVISGSQVSKSVFSSAVRVHSFCNINEAVLLPQVTIGPSCRLQRVVIDRGCTVPEGLVTWFLAATALVGVCLLLGRRLRHG